jgi:hypothetical protein
VSNREEDFILTTDVRIRVGRGTTVMLHEKRNNVKDEDEIRRWG